VITTGDASAQGSAAAGGRGSLCIHLLLDVLLNGRTNSSNKGIDTPWLGISPYRGIVHWQLCRRSTYDTTHNACPAIGVG